MESPRIAIVMCTWQRINLLPLTLNMLENQTFSAFTFYIWNNNVFYKSKILKYLEKSQLKTRVFFNHENAGGMGRFFAAQNISKDFDYVIFIDDDQIFDERFVETLVKEAKPKTISGWFAWKINGEYFNRTPATEHADYIGTGGMICDLDVFKNSNLFEIPKRYWMVEDLWLSFFCKYELGYELLKSRVNMHFMKGEEKRDQFNVNHLGPLKQEFYQYLKNKYINSN